MSHLCWDKATTTFSYPAFAPARIRLWQMNRCQHLIMSKVNIVKQTEIEKVPCSLFKVLLALLIFLKPGVIFFPVHEYLLCPFSLKRQPLKSPRFESHSTTKTVQLSSFLGHLKKILPLSFFWFLWWATITCRNNLSFILQFQNIYHYFLRYRMYFIH